VEGRREKGGETGERRERGMDERRRGRRRKGSGRRREGKEVEGYVMGSEGEDRKVKREEGEKG